MDPTRSESAHQDVPSGPVTLVIQQNADVVSIETKRTRSSETLTYRLDGTENQVGSGSGTPIKTKAHWDGTNLVTETERNVQGSTVTTSYVMSLSADGADLTINKTLTVHHGYQFENANNVSRGKDVYVKVKTRNKPAN